MCTSYAGRYGAGVWIWVAPCAAVLALYVLTTPTFHAVVRPRYRDRSITAARVAVADRVRDEWRRARPDERELLAWAYYRVDALGTHDRPLSFSEFRGQWRVVLASSVAISRYWQRLEDPRWPFVWRNFAAEMAADGWFRLRVFVWPGLLLTRFRRGRLPHLPLRKRLRAAHPHTSSSWRYSVWRRYACLGENGYRAGWYRNPVWDHEWSLARAALESAGVWMDAGTAARKTRLPGAGATKVDRAEFEARQQRQQEQLARLVDEVQEIVQKLIELAEAQRPPAVSRERDEPAPSDPPSSSPPSSGSAGRSGGSSRSDDWGSWSDSHDFYWD